MVRWPDFTAQRCPNGQVAKSKVPKWSGGTAQLRTLEGTLFTAAFSVSFIVTIFVFPDIEIVQKKVICLWIGTTCPVNVARTCSANLYEIYRDSFRTGLHFKTAEGPKWKYGSACCIFSISCRFSILWYVDCKASKSCICICSRFSRCFRDPIRVPTIRENYHRVPIESEKSGPCKAIPGT